MDKAVIYIHGKGGDAEEALHYKSLFSDCDEVSVTMTFEHGGEKEICKKFIFEKTSDNLHVQRSS